MGLQPLVNVTLFIACIIAIVYAIYIKIKSGTYTRERYAFAALSAIVAIVTLAIHSLTARPPWSALKGLVFPLVGIPTPPEPSQHWAEQTLIVILAVTAVLTIYKSLSTWHGLVSVRQKEKEGLHQNRFVLIEGWQEALRILRREGQLPIYRPFDYSRSFPALEAPSETIAWNENARDLIILRWRTHDFDLSSGWHSPANAWIGLNRNTRAVAALLCVREHPTSSQLNDFVHYVKDLMTPQQQHVAGRTVAILTQTALLNELVDFTDYYMEIQRRIN